MMDPKSASCASDKYKTGNVRTIISRLKFAEEETTSRGRGWAKNDKDPLRRPGRALCSEGVDSSNLINIINAVNDKNLDEKIKEIEKCIRDKDAKSFENVHSKLYEYAVKNNEFGTKLIMLYQQFSCDTNSKGIIMRKQLIHSLQSDYERREKLKQENATYFRDVICLFSEFLLQYRGTTKVFIFALLDYMEMLLETASVDDIKVFTKQVIIHGKYMCDISLSYNFKEKLDKLLITARQILIKENIPRASRKMLLYTIDLFNHDFNPLPTNLKEFYKNVMEVTDK